jgi:hypothetical protein
VAAGVAGLLLTPSDGDAGSRGRRLRPGVECLEESAAGLLLQFDTPAGRGTSVSLPIVVPPGAVAVARWLTPGEDGAIEIEPLGYRRFERLARLTVIPGDAIPDPSIARRLEIRFVAATPATPAPAAPQSLRIEPSSLPDGVAWRLVVPATDLWSVSWADLAAAGFPSGIATEDLGLFERTPRDREGRTVDISVPLVVEESGGTPGLFDGDDRVLFYGLDRPDRWGPGAAATRDGRHHNYWLRIGKGGARMPLARTSATAGESTPDRFLDVVRREENLVYSASPPPIGGELFPLRPTHFWTGPFGDTESFLVATPGRAPGGFARVRAFWRGEFGHTHHVSLSLVGACPVGADTLLLDGGRFFGTEEFAFDSGRTIPSTRLADGCNSICIVGRGFPDGRPERIGAGAWFDRFEVEYPRHYRLDGGRLRATTAGARGAVALRIEGFPNPGALVFDVTDSLAPVRLDVSPDDFVRAPGGPAAGWILTVRRHADRQRTILAVVPDAVRRLVDTRGTLPPDLRPGPIVREEPRDLLADTGADIVVVTPDDFRPALDPWLARRTAEGRRALVVSPQDIWNTMTGGDKSVAALRDWLRLLFRTWREPPRDLLLLGDASEDQLGTTTGGDVDHVPTRMLYGDVPGRDQRRELIGSDRWFVGSLHPEDAESDMLPDMHVGRLPAASRAEAAALLEKSLTFEDADPEAPWRRHVALFSDDAYSSDYTMTADYCFRPEERLFEAGADSLAALLSAADCNVAFTVDHLRVRDDLDAAAGLGRTGQVGNCPPIVAAREEARRVLRPRWLSQLAGGALLHVFSGHANRQVLSGEHVVVFDGRFSSPDSRTTERLENWGRPFIFVGLGCHIGEFEAQGEGRTGDSIAESMLLLPGRGAVAAVASTGYERLDVNPVLEATLGRALLLRSARPAGADSASLPVGSRILGEAVDRGLVDALVEYGGGTGAAGVFQGTLRSYTLLGDPTLRLDTAPPRLERFVDGAPLPDGASVVSREPSGDAPLAVRIREDVDWATLEIVDDGVLRDPAAFEVSVDADSTGGCRSGWLRYRAALRPASYDIRVSLVDWAGRRNVSVFPVRLGVDWRRNARPLEPGDRVAPNEVVTLEVEAPLPIDGGRLGVAWGGRPRPVDWTPVGDDGRRWVAVVDLRAESGPTTLQLLVDGAPARSADAERAVIVDAAPRIEDAWFGPSPWSGGPAWFGYRLRYGEGRAPARVRITVYSISGRTVARLDGPVAAGEVTVPWDVRDAAGDPLANGVYLFRVDTAGGDGDDGAPIGRLVLLR